MLSGVGKQKLREEKEIFEIYDEYPLGEKILHQWNNNRMLQKINSENENQLLEIMTAKKKKKKKKNQKW